MRLVHEKNCRECSFTATNDEILSNHFESEHYALIHCSYCEYEAESKEELKIHISSFHESRYFSRSRRPLFRNPIPETRNISNNATNSKKVPILVTHENVSEDMFTCSSCTAGQKTFAHKDALDLHELYFHKNETHQ